MAEYVDYAEYYDSDHDTKDDVGFYVEFARQSWELRSEHSNARKDGKCVRTNNIRPH